MIRVHFGIHGILRYHRAAISFNAYVDLESRGESDKIDASFIHVAWAWLQEHRPEIAMFALKSTKGLSSHQEQEQSECSTQPKMGLKRFPEQPNHGSPAASNFNQPSPKRLNMDLSAEAVKASTPTSSLTSTSATNVGSCPLSASVSASSTSATESASAALSPSPTSVLPSASRPPSASESQLILSQMQANTLDLLKKCDPKGRRVLIVQPCCTGKSAYYTHFAKQKNTMVMLAQPFTSLKEQSESDAAKANLITVVQRGGPLKNVLRNEGMLLIFSYEKLHTQVACQCIVVPRIPLFCASPVLSFTLDLGPFGKTGHCRRHKTGHLHRRGTCLARFPVAA
jgi:hypothetical protein